MLAQVITDHAKRERDIEGAKLRIQCADEAKEEARRIIDSTKQQCTDSINDETSKARAESEEVLKWAQSQAEEIMANAFDARARQDASAVTDAHPVTCDSVGSNDRLIVESTIRHQDASAIADANQPSSDGVEIDDKLSV